MSAGLVHKFRDYSGWRQNVAAEIGAYRRWLEGRDLRDAHTDVRLEQVLEHLAEDKLTIAFVAEFSRGKTELINAIFFSDYGQRLLPSGAGRTTMCPTEIGWDATLSPSLRLLPIETRSTHATVTEFKRHWDEWKSIPLRLDSPDDLATALQHLRETKLVPLEEARNFGLFMQDDPDQAAAHRARGMIEIPCWRHAVINFPHPLLEQGLVILDTPGLNAIGAEPELTLSLLPNAHAILFVLGLDTGVTKSDAQIWRDFLRPVSGREYCRFAVLNKIDTLWDSLRTEREIEAEIQQQIEFCSTTLELDSTTIFPVSAQKALVAKIQGDEALLERSGLPELEHALTAQLIPRRKDIVCDGTRAELAAIIGHSRARLEGRLRSVEDQLQELAGLRGKNLNFVSQMVRKVAAEKQGFERGLANFQAVRSVFSNHANTLFMHLGMEALSQDARRTLRQVRRSPFSSGVRAAMNAFFSSGRARLEASSGQVAEIQQMMRGIYARFEKEHGLTLGQPTEFSLLRYHREFDRLEALYNRHFNTVYAMLTNEALSLVHKFFETIASQVRRVFVYANKESDEWLRALMAPMELQIRERQMQLRRRLESIKRIHEATDTLDDRVHALESSRTQLHGELEELDEMSERLRRALSQESARFAAAA